MKQKRWAVFTAVSHLKVTSCTALSLVKEGKTNSLKSQHGTRELGQANPQISGKTIHFLLPLFLVPFLSCSCSLRQCHYERPKRTTTRKGQQNSCPHSTSHEMEQLPEEFTGQFKGQIIVFISNLGLGKWL